MFVQYAVENYKSIRDEVIINFCADSKYSNSEWVAKDNMLPLSLYKCIGLIGPNASGKSNILESFQFALKFIFNTIKRKDNSMINIEKFAFDEEVNEKPTSFEFIFFKNNVKYVYGFSLNEKEVLEEYLFGYFSEKPETLFDRKINQQYEFKGNDNKIQSGIAKKTNSNRLYMPVAAEWGYAPLKEVYDWFEFISRQYMDFNINQMIGKIIQKEERKQILLNELQKADFNIKDIYIERKRIDQKSHDVLEKFLIELVGDEGTISIPSITPIIRIVHENWNGIKYDIALNEDSDGTESIVQSIAEFLYLSDKGGFILEDELGRSYHTKLVQHFLQMFKSRDINFGNVQMLFATHNTKVLNMLNPDQIYLVDKDELGATFVKLLDDYTISEKDDIELGYLKGRYGGIPYMRG